MKKIITLIASALLAVIMISGLCSCGLLDKADAISKAVTYPEQYSITYDIENTDGVHTTIKKTVDAEGNVYFLSADSEMLFIKNGNTYTLYEKNTEGVFVASGTTETYNATYVKNATAKFSEYAEQSKNQFMPTAKNKGEQTILDRACSVYEVKLGGENNGIKYSYYVDNETGICLGFESGKSIAGFDLGADDEIFTCTEFIISDVASLKDLI